jgi:hypothetical protein
VRIARIHDEEWRETELYDPEACMKELKRSGLSADLLYIHAEAARDDAAIRYPVELESIAAARAADFGGW